MQGLKKIWYCPDCEFFYVTPAVRVTSTCPKCQNRVQVYVPSRILEKEKAAVPIEEIELGIHHYHFIKKIGSGGFGVIYLVKDEKDNYYAMKLPKTFIDLAFAQKEESSLDSHTRNVLVKQNEALSREVKVISKHYFPGMMPLIDFGNFEFAGQTVDFFIQELGYTSLTEFLAWSMQNRFLQKWETRYWFAYEIARAVAQAHNNGVLLRDLSTENVMIMVNETEGVAVKLIDFGGAKTESMSSMLVYRNLYVPPLLLKEKGKKRDVFNLGVLLFEVLSNRPHWINLIGDLSDFQEDEFHRILNNFNNEIITPYLNTLPESEERRSVIQILRKATQIGSDGKYKGFRDAQELLDKLPQVTEIPATIGKILTLKLNFDLSNVEETQEVLLIDKYIQQNVVEAKNAGFIISKNYKIKLLGGNNIIHNKDDQTIVIDIPFQQLKYLPGLNARLFFELKIEVMA